MRALLVAVAVVATAAMLGDAGAGMYLPPPGDAKPQWVSNGVVAFEHLDPQQRGPQSVQLASVSLDGSPDVPVVIPRIASNVPVIAGHPCAPLLAFGVVEGGAVWLSVAAADGSGQKLVFAGGQPVGWLADSSRLVFWRPTDSLASIRPDGTELTEYPANVRGVPSPVRVLRTSRATCRGCT